MENIPFDPIADRKNHLKHEGAVMSIGLLFLLQFVMLCVSLYDFMNASLGGAEPTARVFLVGQIAILAVFGAFFGLVGVGLRRFDPRARRVAVLWISFNLVCNLLLCVSLGPEIGSLGSFVAILAGSILLGSYMLWLLKGKKGTYIFSEDYRRTRAATPQMRYRSSWLKLFFGVFFAMCLLLVLAIVALKLVA